MAGFLSPLQQLAKAYPALTSAKRLQSYTKSRLPAEFSSRGDLIPMGGGTGRMPFALGDDLVVKTARMPRGIKENTMEGDWVAPVPEAVWKSDDDAIAVVKRALPADAKLKRAVKQVLQPALSNAEEADAWMRNYAPAFLKTPEGQEIVESAHERFLAREEALDAIGWSDLLNYNPLWGDIAPRNVGLAPVAERSPILLDAGILDRSIMEPKAIQQMISPAEWMSYRRDVLRAKKDGGPVKMAGGGWLGGALSQLARSKGFHTVGYHGTRVPKLEGDVLRGDIAPHTTFDRMLGPHIALDPRVTNAFTVGEYARNTNPAWLSKGDPRALWGESGEQILEGGNVVPVALRGKYKKVKGDSQWGELRNQITEGIGVNEDLFNKWFSSVRQVPVEEASKVYRAFGRGDPVVLGNGDRLMDLSTLTRMGDGVVTPHRFRAKDDIFSTDLAGYDTPGQIMQNYDAYGYGLTGKEKKALVETYRKRLGKEGYSGVEYQNESTNEIKGDFDPTTFIVSDPDAIRSLFAQFKKSGAGLGKKAGGLAQVKESR